MMFERLYERRELWKARADVRSANKNYARAERQARKEGKTYSELPEVLHDYYSEIRYCEDALDSLESHQLIAKARRCGVPTPAFSSEEGEGWETSGITGGRHLTLEGRAELRSAIRKEQNERWQSWELRLKVLTGLLIGLTGALGALIGLVATLKH